VGRSLMLLIDASAHDLVRVRQSIEGWYNSTMDRVSGWYKRRTQVILFCVGLIITGALNVDTVAIANRLASDPSLRSSLVATAQEYAKGDASKTILGGQVQQNIDRLESLGVPIGWKSFPQRGYGWFLKIAGILASALAATLGAPFWFDILNRFVVIRSTIKPREKCTEEKSKD